jgi:hypothetical protein
VLPLPDGASVVAPDADRGKGSLRLVPRDGPDVLKSMLETVDVSKVDVDLRKLVT